MNHKTEVQKKLNMQSSSKDMFPAFILKWTGSAGDNLPLFFVDSSVVTGGGRRVSNTWRSLILVGNNPFVGDYAISYDFKEPTDVFTDEKRVEFCINLLLHSCFRNKSLLFPCSSLDLQGHTFLDLHPPENTFQLTVWLWNTRNVPAHHWILCMHFVESCYYNMELKQKLHLPSAYMVINTTAVFAFWDYKKCSGFSVRIQRRMTSSSSCSLQGSTEDTCLLICPTSFLQILLHHIH